MAGPFRFVFDTNVVISAMFFEESSPAVALTKGRIDGQLLYSTAFGRELREVVSRDKFDRYVAFNERIEFLNSFFRRAVLFEPTERIQACRDPKDNMILELAVAGQADYIITGDKDLLALNPFRRIQVLTPAEFLKSEL